ncbi:hypothetical protein ACQKMD_19880 [Viridibacillus sp. NPDC096237]|uniref:hypothetical protein n=1 Tax=Viridibacillus sp. NPDC096237 TaxID=3390721 RepID=UPI003CFC6C52
MKVTEFIASLIDEMIWPIVIILAIILFRRQIGFILMNITRFSFNNIELDFGKKLNDLEKKLNNSHLIENEPPDIYSKDREILRIAKESPEESIPMIWGIVENELQSTVHRLGINQLNDEVTYSHKDIRLLKEYNLIDGEIFTTFNELRNMKIQLSRGHFIKKEPTYTDALKYYDLSNKIIIIFNDANITVLLPKE